MAPAGLIAAGLAAYANTFKAPFLFDDSMNVVGNFSAKHLRTALFPPADFVTGGRPLLNLSFALNYAWGRLNVVGYHAVNLGVHVAAALVLFGIFRRMLIWRSQTSGVAGREAAVAFAAALIWTVHPLQTEAITYISQRAESLMALFYLLTVYGFIRAVGSSMSLGWMLTSVASCLAGSLTKELIATAPIVVLLLDYFFVEKRFAVIWDKRKFYYLALASSWIVLGFAQAGLKRVGVGLHTGVSSWVFALFSCRTICRYIRLICWPSSLVLDYGDIPRFMLIPEYLPYALVVVLLLSLGVWLFLKGNSTGLVLLCFFIVLAPTHSIIPLSTQPMAEHRVYLGLGCFALLASVGAYLCLGARAPYFLTVLMVLLAGLTYRRNRDYSSVVGIWKDVLLKVPGNPRAHYAIGGAYYLDGRYADAEREFEKTIELAPEFADAYSDLGLVLSERPGGTKRSIELFQKAIAKNPTDLRVHVLLGLALKKIRGRENEAIEQFQTAIRMGVLQTDTTLPVAYTELARLLSRKTDMTAEAIKLYHEALDLSPDDLDAEVGLCLLGNANPQAEAEIARKLRLDLRDHPDSIADHYDLAQIVSKAVSGPEEAISEYETALRIDPGFADAHNNLGVLLMRPRDRWDDAVAQFRAAIACNPNLTPAYYNLGCALDEREGHRAEAIAAFQEAIRLDPHYAEAHNNLGIVLVEQTSTLSDAIREFQAALRDRPGYADAQANLDLALHVRAERSAKEPVSRRRTDGPAVGNVPVVHKPDADDFTISARAQK